MPAADPRPDQDSGKPPADLPQQTRVTDAAATTAGPTASQRELGGPAGPEPTRFGDWEKGGRCIDF